MFLDIIKSLYKEVTIITISGKIESFKIIICFRLIITTMRDL